MTAPGWVMIEVELGVPRRNGSVRSSERHASGYLVAARQPDAVIDVEVAGIRPHSRDQFLGLANPDRWPLGQKATKPPNPESRKVQVRLSSAGVARMIAEYETGARTTELARQYGVHRITVQRMLKARDVVLRRRAGSEPSNVE